MKPQDTIAVKRRDLFPDRSIELRRSPPMRQQSTMDTYRVLIAIGEDHTAELIVPADAVDEGRLKSSALVQRKGQNS